MVSLYLLVAAAVALLVDVYAYLHFKQSTELLNRVRGRTAIGVGEAARGESKAYGVPKEIVELEIPKKISYYDEVSRQPSAADETEKGDVAYEFKSIPQIPSFKGYDRDYTEDTLTKQAYYYGDKATSGEFRKLGSDLDLLKNELATLKKDYALLRKTEKKPSARELKKKEEQIKQLYMERKIDEETYRHMFEEVVKRRLGL
ncbi:hypothetical protein HY991_02040 [Candidatus Micrarchaeota archaeon]|nr:hypothetical protein [Candidatus Micrarchaeota archaeon]